MKTRTEDTTMEGFYVISYLMEMDGGCFIYMI